jgi:hypothetical protein
MQETIAAEADEGSEDRKRIVRRLAHATWQVQWTAANPDAGAEARKAAWKAARPEAVKVARKVLRLLEKKGVALTVTDAAAAEDAGEE